MNKDLGGSVYGCQDNARKQKIIDLLACTYGHRIGNSFTPFIGHLELYVARHYEEENVLGLERRASNLGRFYKSIQHQLMLGKKSLRTRTCTSAMIGSDCRLPEILDIESFDGGRVADGIERFEKRIDEYSGEELIELITRTYQYYIGWELEALVDDVKKYNSSNENDLPLKPLKPLELIENCAVLLLKEFRNVQDYLWGIKNTMHLNSSLFLDDVQDTKDPDDGQILVIPLPEEKKN